MSFAAALVDPTRKDVVVAVLGASAALGGFVLVFLGLSIATAQSYSGAIPDSVKEKYAKPVWSILAVFALCIVTIALAFAWLASSGGTCFYRLVIWTFAAELLAIVGVASMTTIRLLK